MFPKVKTESCFASASARPEVILQQDLLPSSGLQIQCRFYFNPEAMSMFYILYFVLNTTRKI